MIGVIGSSNYDIVLNVEDFTLPGATQKALSVDYFPGGKGANQAVCVAKLSEKQVFFLTCIGNDQFGDKLRDIYENLNIDGFVQVNESNGLAFIEVNKKGENRIIIHPGANALLSVDIVKSDLEKIAKLSIILLQNEIPIEATIYAAKVCKDLNKCVILDPAPAENIPIEIVNHLDYITPNETELKRLSVDWFGSSLSPEEFYKRLSTLNPKIRLIYKHGENGSTIYLSEETIHMKAFVVEPVDTTAAGDVFNGAFAVALDEGKSLEEALKFANAAAAISVTKKGAQSSIPSRREVEEFLKAYIV